MGNFHCNEFIKDLILNWVFPVYNVKNASGLTGLLDLHPNEHVHDEFIKQRKVMERVHPELLLTRTGNPRALPRHQLALSIKNAMNAVKRDQTKLHTYKQHSNYLGYTLKMTDLEHGSNEFMKHSMKSLSKSELKEFKCLTNTKINPITATPTQLLQTRKKPGRKPTDLGKLTTSYGKNELVKIKSILSLHDEQNVNFKSMYSKLLILVKRAAVIAAKQIQKAMNLDDDYIARQLPQETIFQLYQQAMSYDLFGLMHELKDSNCNNSTDNYSDHLGKYNFNKPSKKKEQNDKNNYKMLSKYKTKTMDYYLGRRDGKRN